MSSEVSLVPLRLHWGSLEFTQYSDAGDGYGNDTLMQSGPRLFSLSLRRQAILLTNDWVTLGCELFPIDVVLTEQEFVFCEGLGKERHTEGSKMRTGFVQLGHKQPCFLGLGFQHQKR